MDIIELYKRIMQRQVLKSDLLSELIRLHQEQDADINEFSRALAPRKTVTIVAATDPDHDDDGRESTGIYVNGKRIAQGPSGYVEPEDASFTRDYGWVLSAFDGIARACGANVEYVDVSADDLPDVWPPVEPSSKTELCPPPIDGAIGKAILAPAYLAPYMPLTAPSTAPTTVDSSDVQSSHLAAATVEERGTRQKHMTTAKEWGESLDFLTLMKTAPFSRWTAEEQIARRDAFVASVPKDKMQNRWGRSFRKFCGGATNANP